MSYWPKIKNISSFLTAKQFHFFLIAFGIILRLKLYLENRSFWVDETWVATNIASRSLGEIFHHIPALHDWPNRPLGFSLIEKISIILLGNNEYAFRLYPLVAGISAIFLFYALLKRLVEPRTQTIALGTFVLSPQLIYFSAELKQFSSDVLVVLVLYWVFENIRSRNYDSLEVLFFGFIGGVAVWFSHATLFILAATGFILVSECYVKKRWDLIRILIAVFLFWLINFIFLYTFCLRHTLTNPSLLNYWSNKEKLLMIPLWSWQGIVWLKHSIINVFSDPLGLLFPWFWVLIFIFGCVHVFKKNRMHFYLFFLPIVITLLVAILKKYLFYGRYILFLIPSLAVFLSSGIQYLTERKYRLRKVAWAILIIVLFFVPIQKSIQALIHSSSREENRQVLRYLKENYEQGDVLFMNGSAMFAYNYYATVLNLIEEIPKTIVKAGKIGDVPVHAVAQLNNRLLSDQDGDYIGMKYIYSVFNAQGYYRYSLMTDEIYRIGEDASLDVLSRERVWIFLSHLPSHYRDFLLNIFDRQGKRIKTFEAKGAAVYLYQIN